MSFKTSLKHQTPKWVNVLFLSLLMFFVVVITLTPPSFAQSTTSRNRVRQALVVRRQRPLVPVAGDDSASTNSSSSSTTLSTTTSNVETDQEEVIADENEDRHLAKPQTNGRIKVFFCQKVWKNLFLNFWSNLRKSFLMSRVKFDWWENFSLFWNHFLRLTRSNGI